MLDIIRNTNILLITLIFIRISTLLTVFPLFGDTPTPLKIRILLAVTFTVGIYTNYTDQSILYANQSVLDMFFLVVKEIILGFIIAFIARAILEGILNSVSIVAYQMGFGTSSLFLPGASSSTDAFSSFHRMIIMLLFLTLNLHHVFIDAIYSSFIIVPSGHITIPEQISPMVIEISAQLFVVCLKLAAPIVVALLFTMAALGLIARIVPQMNIFSLSFPISFAIGLIIYIFTLAYYPSILKNSFEEIKTYSTQILNLAKP